MHIAIIGIDLGEAAVLALPGGTHLGRSITTVTLRDRLLRSR